MTIKKINNGSDEQFVGEANIVAPFTTIQNRAKVEANCKVVGPVERIRVNSLREIPNEFGPNGETVYTSDKEDSRVRFVGSWSSIFNSYGTRPQSAVTGNYVELSFYGTGLNILSLAYSGFDVDYSVDGGVSTSLANAYSDILGNRNYNENSNINVTSGLSLGWHTIKLDFNGTNQNSFGFEILNESANLSVLSGSVFKNGYEHILESDTTIPMIPTSYAGTNGARCLVYLDEKSQVQQAINEVGSPAYLTNTDHSNEAIYRKVNFREFGRNRADDFSTLGGTTSDRAFTLDDGTTTLVGNNVTASSTALGGDASFELTITFVGTGLDITCGTTNDFLTMGDVIINGTQVGQWERKIATQKICSNLPYGTHTIEFTNIVGTFGEGISNFIIYRPKKPYISKSFPILADYNINADFVANTVPTENNIATGVTRKHAIREFVYSGTWSTDPGSGVFPTTIGGIGTASQTNGGYFEYTFVGTGFEYRLRTGTNRSNNITLSLNGDTDLSSYTSSTYGAGITYNSTTGLLTTKNATSEEGGLAISGLPLGKYTLRFTLNDTDFLTPRSLDIITPIHSPNLMIGNQSMSDERENNKKYNVEVYGAFDRLNNYIFDTFNISQILATSTARTNIYYEDVFISAESLISSITSDRPQAWNIENRKNYFEIITTDSAGTISTSTRSYVSVIGRLEKDIFKD